MPWTASIGMKPVDGEMYEFACHEGNYGMVGILTGARADEQAGEVPAIEARQASLGDKLDALVAYLESSAPTLDDKNRAIGLLGELRDRRALPVLDALDRGDACDHARFVCQRERRKAINKIQGNGFEPLAAH